MTFADWNLGTNKWARQRAPRWIPRKLRMIPSSRGQVVVKVSSATSPSVKIPQSIRDIDNGRILGFGASLALGHPGFHDEEYKLRRVMLSKLAKDHCIDDRIPLVNYTEQETKVWAEVLRELKQLFPTYACAQFLQTFPLFNFREEEVPQLQDVSEALTQHCGWRIRPVAGLMHQRDFLNGLAFKVFHSTQYMRHHSNPNYTPEPDICHELIGHVPLLADPDFGQLVQEIGIASLGADDATVNHLTKVYWYTVEFGVLMEQDQLKAFGAGILSSFGEMKHMAAGKAALEPLDPFKPQPKMSYKDGYQSRYFVWPSFQEGILIMRDYMAKTSLRKAE